MKHKYILNIIVFLLVIQMGFLIFLHSNENNFASAINRAGKQRMLLQKIAFSATSSLLVDHEYQRDETINNLKSSISEFKANHAKIIKGDADHGIGICLSKKLNKIYFNAPYDIDKNIRSFIVDARTVLNEANNKSLSRDSLKLQRIESDARQGLIQSLDVAVSAFEEESLEKTESNDNIFIFLIAFMGLTLMFGVYEVISFLENMNNKSKSLKLSKYIFDHSVDGIITIDENGIILTSNDKTRELTGYSAGAIVGSSLSSLIGKIALHESILNELMTTVVAAGEWRGEIIQKNKRFAPISVGVRAVYSDADADADTDSHVKIINYIMTLTDISQQKESEDQFRFLSLHDHLTGLLNRSAIYSEYKTLEAIAKRDNHQLNVMMMDLDGFKAANDKYGHDAGDYVLITISKRIKEALRESDILARFGGDEFAVLALQSGGEIKPEVICKKILEAVAVPIIWEEQEIKIGISIGVASYPGCGSGFDTLISQADDKMYQVKKHRKNNYAICSCVSEQRCAG